MIFYLFWIFHIRIELLKYLIYRNLTMFKIISCFTVKPVSFIEKYLEKKIEDSH
jgi:hypothetical protein